MKLGFAHIAGIVAAFQSFILGTYLILSPYYRKNSRLPLAGMFFLYPLFILSAILMTSFELLRYSPLSSLAPHIVWLIGPLLFFHVRGMAPEKAGFARNDVLHFLPFIAAIICQVREVSFRLWFFWEIPHRYSLSLNILDILHYSSFISLFIYVATCVRSLYLRDGDPKVLVKNIVIYFGHLSFIFAYFFLYGNLENYLLAPYIFFAYLAAVFIVNTAYVFLFFRAPGLVIREKKYANSSLSPEQRETYKNRLLSCLSEKKPYLTTELTMNSLAEMSRIPARFLSQIINEEFDKNYYDFINHYRIEESKKLLSGAESDMRIIGVLYEVGFNSKSTFNAAFKKETGLTPRQYKSLLKKKFK